MTFTRLRSLPDPDNLPALDAAYLSAEPARGLGSTDPAPRILLLYGSLRERSYSRLCVEEAARLLRRMGCETRIFDPSDLPNPEHNEAVNWARGDVSILVTQRYDEDADGADLAEDEQY